MSAVAWASCASPAAGPAAATGWPGEVAEFAAADGALAGAVEAVTAPACGGMVRAEPGAAARVPVAHAVASAPTATMPAPALTILLLVLGSRLIRLASISIRRLEGRL